jgi:hypothetical protein
MKLNNITQIRAEDFDPELQETMEQLGTVLNTFMQQVVELADGRVDFENRVESIIQFEVTVDSSGNPIQNNKVKTKNSSIRGFDVIRAYNLTNSNIYPTQKPFVNYKEVGSGVIEMQNIVGLQSDNKYLLTAIVY